MSDQTEMLAETFTTLPFPAQMEQIEAALSAPASLPPLLAILRSLPDHEPLAFTWRGIASRGWLDDEQLRQGLFETLSTLPDTGVQRLLKGMEQVPLEPALWERLAAVTLEVVEAWPLERLAALCLADRWLKHAAPSLRQEWLTGQLAQIEEALATKAIDAISDEALLQLPGRAFVSFEEVARAHGLEEVWHQRLAQFSRRVLSILQQAPRSLSQANAEELLSKRVYTDPGHFLVELFQNAEDARASSFAVELREDAVWIRHDGVPFDAKDVVGVLSIGQTTKAREQIGFFGVGFKSVYEICERPQIYSRVFSFEIADISIPRPLQSHPERLPEETLLCLPYRQPLRPTHQPASMYQRALSVPPETLLTLKHLKHFRVAYGEESRSVQIEPGQVPGLIELKHLESGHVQAYLTASDHFVYERQKRELSRATETDALVAIRLDEDGFAIPLPVDAPTLFSHLPTDERSGLRFLFHAHFDLPVDRERLQLSSDWNMWALSLAGLLLARLLSQLAEEAAQGHASDWHRRRLLHMLDVLPLKRELLHQAFDGILKALCEEARDIPMLPQPTTGWVAPKRALLIDEPALVEVLQGVPLDREGRLAAAFLTGRRHEVAAMLGAQSFALDALLDLLEDTCKSGGEGPQEWPAKWLEEGVSVIFEVLGRWLQELPLASQEEALGRLRSLVMFPDQEGAAHQIISLPLASPSIRSLYGNARCFVASWWEQDATTQQSKLLSLLAPPRHDASAVLRDLREEALRAAILSHAGPEAVLSFLSRLQKQERCEVGRLPLFPVDCQEGAFGPIHAEMEGALWLVPDAPLFELITSMAPEGVAFVDASLCRTFGPLLASLGGRVLDLTAWLSLLQTKAVSLDPEQALRLHSFLQQQEGELTPRQCRQLVSLPLFLDRDGRLRPLVGDDCVFFPEDDYVIAFSPKAPWLAPQLTELDYIKELPFALVDSRKVLSLMASGEATRLFDPGSLDALRRGYQYLLLCRERLSGRELHALVGVPLWLDQEGRQRLLSQLLAPTKDEQLAALFGVLDERFVIESEGEASALSVLSAIGLEQELATPNVQALVQRLSELGEEWLLYEELRDGLMEVLIRSVDELSPELLGLLLPLPLFASEGGELYPVGAWSTPVETRVYRPGRVFRPFLSLLGLPLLEAQEEQTLAPLLDALVVPEADWPTVVRLFERWEPASRDEAREALRALLVEHRTSLPTDRELLSRLQGLPVWPASGGGWVAAAEALRPAWMEEVLGARFEALWRGRRESLLAPEAEPDAALLSAYLPFREPLSLLHSSLETMLLAETVLSQQIEPFTTRELLVASWTLMGSYLEEEAWKKLPLIMTSEERLSLPPLYTWEPAYYALCEGLSVSRSLVDVDWWELANSRSSGQLGAWVEPLSPAKWLRQLLQATQEDAEHCLTTPEGRQLLYQYLLEHEEEWVEDVSFVDLLGRTPCLLSEAGVVRSPRELLWGEEGERLQALALDEWLCDDSVPVELQALFEQLFQLEEDALQRWVGILAEAHRAIQADANDERSVSLLQAMAEALCLHEQPDPEWLEQVARKHKLIRLRVGTTEGQFERLGKLMFPPPEQQERMASFLAKPPAFVHPRYESPEIRSLLLAIGVPASPDVEQLRVWLSGSDTHLLQKSEWAGLSWAQYLALLLAEDASLAKTLQLDKKAWVPDGEGKRRPASALYWPAPEVFELVGERPSLFPHSMFFHTVPEDICQALPFLRAKQVRVEDVLSHLRRLEGVAPFVLLEWLEHALREKRVEADELVTLFSEHPLLRDEEGEPSFPKELICTPASDWIGTHKRIWPDGLRFSKLAATLEISHRVTPDDIYSYGDLLLRELALHGPKELLRTRPALSHQLPRCLAFLAAHDAPAKAFPLLVETFTGTQGILSWTDPSLVLPSPRWLAQQLGAQGASSDVWFPIWDDHALTQEEVSFEAIVVRWLGRCGVPTLEQLCDWKPLPSQPPYDITPTVADAVSALRPKIERLLAHEVVAGWSASEGSRSQSLVIRVVSECSQEVLCLGRSFHLQVDAVFEPARVRLVLVEEALADESLLAGAFVRAWREHIDDRGRWLSFFRGLLSGETPILPLTPKELSSTTSHSEQAPAFEYTADLPHITEEDRRRLRESHTPETGTQEEGWWGRLQQWWSGEKAEEPQPKEPESSPPIEPSGMRKKRQRRSGGGSGRRQQDHWFRPRGTIESQLDGSGRDWLESRNEQPAYGFAIAPSPLPFPHLYAPQFLAGRFHPPTQRWLASPTDPSWRESGPEEGMIVSVTGTIPAGENLFPLPMYGYFEDPKVEGLRVLRTGEGATLLIAQQDVTFSGRLLLPGAPMFEVDEQLPEVGGEWLTPLVPTQELPEEVVDFVSALRMDPVSLLDKALAVRHFIRTRYVYDPSYIEDPAVARWLSKISKGSQHQHIAALHAGADGTHLGRGVCYELGALACELLRRVGIPAGVSPGWTWEEGQVTDPDHMWAMALLPSDLGPRWLPIDAASTVEGRPLRMGHRPRGDWQVKPPEQPRQAPKEPDWAKEKKPPRRRRSSRSRTSRSAPPSRRPSAPVIPRRSSGPTPPKPRADKKERPPVAEMMRVVRHLQELAGEPHDDPRALQKTCKRLLEDRRAATRLLALLPKKD